MTGDKPTREEMLSKAVELLKEVADCGAPVIYDGNSNLDCDWCGAEKADDGKPFRHQANCLWYRVPAFLSEYAEMEALPLRDLTDEQAASEFRDALPKVKAAVAKLEEKPPQIIDLMEALKDSLARWPK